MATLILNPQMKKIFRQFIFIAVFLFLVIPAYAATILVNPQFQAFDDNGDPLSGGKLYTYKAGTSTDKATYSDRALTTPNTNPVILDSRGESTIYGAGVYKLLLKDSNDVQIWLVDHVQGIGNSAFTSVSDYSSIHEAISSIGATEITLYIDDDVTMTQNDTIPSTMTLKVLHGAQIDGAFTLEINGTIEAGPYQIFGSNLTVTGLREAYPEWWGIDGTADEVEINKAITAAFTTVLKSDSGSTPSYTVSGPISIKSRKTLRGQGIGSTTIKLKDSATAATVLQLYDNVGAGEDDPNTFLSASGDDTAFNITIEGFLIDGNKANNAALTEEALYFPFGHYDNTVRSVIRDVEIINAPATAFRIADGNGLVMDSCTARLAGTIGFDIGTGDVKITNSDAANTGTHGFLFRSSIIGDNLKAWFTGTGDGSKDGDAFRLSSQDSGVSLSNLFAQDCDGDALYLGDVDNGIFDIVSAGNSGSGLHLLTGSKNNIINLVVTDSSGGLSLDHTSGVYFESGTGNTVNLTTNITRPFQGPAVSGNYITYNGSHSFGGEYLYDFAVHGGTAGQITIGYLPTSAVITNAYFQTITAPTSGGAATLRFGVESVDAAGLRAATAYDSPAFGGSFVFVDGDVDTGTDLITETTHGMSTGDLVTLSTTGTLPAGLTATTYYVYKYNADTFGLAATRDNAFNGTLVDITAAAGGGNHTVTGNAFQQFIPDGDPANFTTKTDTDREMRLLIENADLTAGKIRLFLEYIIVD